MKTNRNRGMTPRRSGLPSRSLALACLALVAWLWGCGLPGPPGEPPHPSLSAPGGVGGAGAAGAASPGGPEGTPPDWLPALDPPLDHFSILIGVARLQDSPRYRLDPDQAAQIAARLASLQRNSAALLVLDRALAGELTEEQLRFLEASRGQPEPIDFFGHLDRSLDLLAARGGAGAVRPGPVPDLPDGRNEDRVDCVVVAFGLPSMDAKGGLAVSPEQAARLGPLLARVRELAWEDEQSMRAMYHALTPEQKQHLRRRCPAWVGDRTPRDLEEEFEVLLQEAARRVPQG